MKPPYPILDEVRDARTIQRSQAVCHLMVPSQPTLPMREGQALSRLALRVTSRVTRSPDLVVTHVANEVIMMLNGRGLMGFCVPPAIEQLDVNALAMPILPVEAGVLAEDADLTGEDWEMLGEAVGAAKAAEAADGQQHAAPEESEATPPAPPLISLSTLRFYGNPMRPSTGTPT